MTNNSGKVLNSHREHNRSKLSVSVMDSMMGPSPPGHHHRMLTDGISLITPGILTERSNSNLRQGPMSH
jgi:hypothetical protein